MKQRFEQFLTNWTEGNKDIEELKALYFIATGKTSQCGKDICIQKLVDAVNKYNFKTFVNPAPGVIEPRKYTLKPGNHSFAAKGPSIHNNNNTTDEDIEAYLQIYPHIQNLLA